MANARKHGVTFQDAGQVLADDEGTHYHVEEHDDAHSLDEDRWLTTGSHPLDRRVVLRIVWTERTDDVGTLTRIIGARAASRRERSVYEEEISRR